MEESIPEKAECPEPFRSAKNRTKTNLRSQVKIFRVTINPKTRTNV